jgi:hypothetical protein
MGVYAEVENGIVKQLTVVSDDLDTSEAAGVAFLQGLFRQQTWVKTAPNLRANPAVIGGTYDAMHDVFYVPQPFPSWTLNQVTWQWAPPTPMPTPGMYSWDESTKAWVAADSGT